MTYRGDDEPEYIDDDEYYDPDERVRKGGRRRSNVLGGSFRAGRDEPSGGASAPRRPTSKRMNRPSADSGKRRPAANAGRGERRPRPAAVPQAKPESPAQRDKPRGAEKPKGGGRLAGLRGRLPGGKAAQTDGKSDGRGGKSATIARGLRGRLDGLRQRGQAKSSPAAGPAQSSVGRAGQGARARQKDTRSAGRRANQAAAAPAGRTSADKRPKLASSDWLDLDRKLDLAGVGLVFGAIALFFSALSQEHAAISAVHNFIGQLFGWGAIAVPTAMFAVGMWLLARHFGEKAPVIDPVRLAGMAIAFVGLLTFFQYLDSFGYEAAIPDAMRAQQIECALRTTGRDACEQEIVRLAECERAVTAGCLQELAQYAYQRGQGGGYVGGWLYLTLVSNVTEIGGFVILAMLLTFSAMMITRLSMAEMAVVCMGVGRSLRSRMAQQAAKRRAQQFQVQQGAELRVSKPPAAQLPGARRPALSLPQPAADTNMPIPPARVEKREFLRRGGQSFAAVEPSEESGLFARLFGRRKSQADEPPAAQSQPAASAMGASGAGLRERFRSRAASQPSPALDAAQPTSVGPAIEAMPSKVGVPRPMKPKDDVPDGLPPGIPDRKAEKPVKSQSSGTGPPPAKRPQAASVKKPVSSGPVSTRPRAAWKLPDYHSLLSSKSATDFDREGLMKQAQVIEETLASFGAPGRIVEINAGPVITQFGIEPDYLTSRAGKKSRVKVSAIAQLDKDLQLALGAKSIRVEAPVPGKGYVGVEVPNPNAALVSLRDIMESESFRKIKSPLAIALGMSVDGRPISADLTQMPHLLIAGTTGSGKSVCVNAIISSILATNSPETVKFIMVDPKRVELTGYNGLPHLIAPVVVELERIVGVLKWITREMDERYKKFSNVGARHLIDYNSGRDADLDPMPYIVVIIDELADLMMLAPEDTERAITRIAALARATGIHLIIATQRPSVDVVTGLIKANFPARIAFAVAGSVDSRVILDQPGAERLLGTGDMLYLSGDAPGPLRLQGVFVSDEEINSIGRYWKSQQIGVQRAQPISIEAAPLPQRTAGSAPDSTSLEPSEQAAFWDMSAARGQADGSDPQEDKLYQKAVDMVRRLDKASVSLLQRRLRIGYTRAARLVDMMEERGVVGPVKEGSSKPRDVLPE